MFCVWTCVLMYSAVAFSLIQSCGVYTSSNVYAARMSIPSKNSFYVQYTFDQYLSLGMNSYGFAKLELTFKLPNNQLKTVVVPFAHRKSIKTKEVVTGAVISEDKFVNGLDTSSLVTLRDNPEAIQSFCKGMAPELKKNTLFVFGGLGKTISLRRRFIVNKMCRNQSEMVHFHIITSFPFSDVTASMSPSPSTDFSNVVKSVPCTISFHSPSTQTQSLMLLSEACEKSLSLPEQKQPVSSSPLPKDNPSVDEPQPQPKPQSPSIPSLSSVPKPTAQRPTERPVVFALVERKTRTTSPLSLTSSSSAFSPVERKRSPPPPPTASVEEKGQQRQPSSSPARNIRPPPPFQRTKSPPFQLRRRKRKIGFIDQEGEPTFFSSPRAKKPKTLEMQLIAELRTQNQALQNENRGLKFNLRQIQSNVNKFNHYIRTMTHI